MVSRAGRPRRVRLTRLRRAGALGACLLAVLLLIVALEREVALLDLARGNPQQLNSADALVWVAGLWAVLAVCWSALALRGEHVARPALLLPVVVLLGGVLLLLGQGGRHECCYYHVSTPVLADAVVEPDTVDLYTPPPLARDLLLLVGCLAVGVALPLALRALQLRRVSTSASTPPG